MKIIQIGLAAFFLLFAPSNSTYITTCHNDAECGSVCGTYGSDTVAFSEGLFGTSCTCQPGASLVKRCNRDGVDVYVCSDYKAPRCSVPCNQKVCITANTGKKATATIRSACPRHHPQNTGDCCNYGGSYCTCIKQDTADLNWAPYQALGLVDSSGRSINGWATSITVGPCGKQNTGISIYSDEAQEYLKKHHHKLCEVEEEEDQLFLAAPFEIPE